MSEKIKICGKRLLLIFIVIIFIFGIDKVLKFLLIDDTSSYTRTMMHELYRQENIDVLFLGSSHCYRSLDTDITDKIFGENTFNAGSSSQSLTDSFLLLKEAGKGNHIQTVYLELAYFLQFDEDDDVTSSFIITDYMKPSLQKYDYLLRVTPKEQWINGILLGRRNWNKLDDFKYITGLIQKKMIMDYRAYEPVEYENEYYKRKGFVYNNEKIKTGSFIQKEGFEKIEMNMIDNMACELDKIIAYCDEHNIQLVLYSAPMPDYRLVSLGNYDDYITQIQFYLTNKDVTYTDFNLCKEEYLPLEDDCFKDDNHLNGKGAEIFSNTFADYFCSNENTSDIFYHCYCEKIADAEDKFLGLIYNTWTKDKKNYCEIQPVQIGNREFVYTIYSRKENSDKKIILQEKENNCTIILPKDTERIFIEVYEKDKINRKITDTLFYMK